MKKIIFSLTISLFTLNGYAQSDSTGVKYKKHRKEYSNPGMVDFNKTEAKNGEDFYIEGTLKTSQQDYQEAIADFNKAIEINPNISKNYIGRGDAKRYLEDFRGAIADYTKAIKLNPNYAGVYYIRGITKGILLDYEGAVNDYTKSIEINPKVAKVYTNMGLIKLIQGQKDSGCLDLSKAGELGDDNAYQLIKKSCN